MTSWQGAWRVIRVQGSGIREEKMHLHCLNPETMNPMLVLSPKHHVEQRQRWTRPWFLRRESFHQLCRP